MTTGVFDWYVVKLRLPYGDNLEAEENHCGSEETEG